jgi:hypothetical protein
MPGGGSLVCPRPVEAFMGYGDGPVAEAAEEVLDLGGTFPDDDRLRPG